MGKIKAVCISKEKGTGKKNINKGILKTGFGLEGDAHADTSSHRQVSLLSMESIKRMQEKVNEIGPGDFGENLVTEEVDLLKLKIGDKIIINQSVILEVTQKGKECHSPCSIFKKAGECIMPEQGIFTKVLTGGPVEINDTVEIKKVPSKRVKF